MLLAVINRFFHWMVIGVISPVMVLMIISKGVSLESVGFIMAILSIFVVLFEVPSGIISDRIGRKTIYLISLAVFIVSFVVIMLSRGFWLIAVGFSLFGLARAFSSGSIESDFIDHYLIEHGEGQLHKIITGMGLGETLGLALGALLGGYLPVFWSQFFPNDNRYNGNLLAPIVIVSILIILTMLTHSQKSPIRHQKLGVFLGESLGFVRSSKPIRLLLAGVWLWGFAFSAIELYWQPQLQAILGSARDSWIFGGLNGGYFLAAAFGTALVGYLLTLTKLSRFAAIGILKLLMGISMVLLAFQGQVAGFAVLFILIMGFNGMVNVPENTAFNVEIPVDKRSSLLSLSSLVMQLGGILASVLFSLLVGSLGIGTIWIIAGLAFALSSILYFYLAKTTI